MRHCELTVKARKVTNKRVVKMKKSEYLLVWALWHNQVMGGIIKYALNNWNPNYGSSHRLGLGFSFFTPWAPSSQLRVS